MESEINGIRRTLTKLELEFDYASQSEPRMTDYELSILITSLALHQEALERKICDELSSHTGTTVNHL